MELADKMDMDEVFDEVENCPDQVTYYALPPKKWRVLCYTL